MELMENVMLVPSTIECHLWPDVTDRCFVSVFLLFLLKVLPLKWTNNLKSAMYIYVNM